MESFLMPEILSAVREMTLRGRNAMYSLETAYLTDDVRRGQAFRLDVQSLSDLLDVSRGTEVPLNRSLVCDH